MGRVLSEADLKTARIADARIAEAFDRLDISTDEEFRALRDDLRWRHDCRKMLAGYRLADVLTQIASPGADVRGNKHSKVYHRPHCPGYTTIAARHRVEFRSEADARAAGYRMAGNCP